MATKFPLVLYGTSIQEMQVGDTLDSSTLSSSVSASTLLVSGTPRAASVDTPNNGTPNTIPCRDSAGDINARQFNGTATSALFADLAEKYLADKEYEAGTVVTVGGIAEITECMAGDKAFGAVSANPAFKMNDGLEGGTYVALKGRLPIKVTGPVRKGDKLVAANNGCAKVKDPISQNETFAIALQSSDDLGTKLVEAIII